MSARAKKRETRIRYARRLLNFNYDATREPAVQWCWDQPMHDYARMYAASMAMDGAYGGRWRARRPSPRDAPATRKDSE